MAEDLHAGDGVTTCGELTVSASLVRAAALAPGLLFADRYRIVELLGSGGMGDVYRAHDTMLDVQVALKRVSRARADDAAHVVREVRLARQITHRAVCRVFDVGETGGEHYITMEIDVVPFALTTAMTLALMYSLLVMLLRRGWLAASVFLGILAAVTLLQIRVSPVEFFVLLISLTLWVVVFVRFGLLSLTAYLLVDRMLLGLPLSFTGDWRSEFAVVSLVVLGAILTLPAYASLRMRPA